ncbi:lipase family protein [Acinetobacter dispersus]|uniref:alpha/beta hydrolase n=1 Tax=Acinetobacter dispersus TaxID=70348 RepID=UPI0021CD880F|nr:alpha/beta hydrolase [Acinetobacter dispersus]MCU4336084.1 alpha/beta hydrolase [Acinetobacter dispersus]
MKFTGLIQLCSKLQFPDRPKSNAKTLSGPCIATIYGFASREHMQRNLLRFLRQSGYENTTMYGHLQAKMIADDLQYAASQGQSIVIIGFSQGGLEAVRVANELHQRGVCVDLLVTIAAGGRGGYFWPHRWEDDPRNIPANVLRCINYFSSADFLGTDSVYEDNLAKVTHENQYIENIYFPAKDRISHMSISKSYPTVKVHPQIQLKLLQRIINELVMLK